MSSRYAKKRKHDLDSDTTEKSSRPRESSSKKSRRRESSGSPEPNGSGNADSMSIEETNKLRISLGLAPLEVDDEPKVRESETGDPNEKVITEDGMEFVHKPSENIAKKKQADKLKEKLELQKQKRVVQSKLKTKGLADSSSDDEESAESWVDKQRRIAEQKARELEEMDNEIEKSAAPVPKKARRPPSTSTRSDAALAGMTIGHSKEAFLTGDEQILVLDDKSVLDEDGEEVLVNPTLMYAEQVEKNRQMRKKKSDYNPYEEEEIDEFGVVKRKEILSKYDEGLDGPNKRETFKLDEHGGVDINREARELQEKRNLFMANKQLQSLETPRYKVASEFYTEEEMISFRKPKKKKDSSKSRKRKVLKADDLLPEPEGETAEERKAKIERLRARNEVNVEEGNEVVNNEAASSRNGNTMDVDKEEGEVVDDAPLTKKELFKDTMGATIDKSKMHSILSKLAKDEEDEDDNEDFAPMNNLAGVVIDDEGEDELSMALERARKLRALDLQKEKTKDGASQVKEMLSKLKKEEDDEMEVDAEDEDKHVVFDSTAEYYKTIGSLPTLGLAGNRSDDVDYTEVMEEQARELAVEKEKAENRQKEKDRESEESEDTRRHHHKMEDKKRNERTRERDRDDRKHRRDKDRRQRHRSSSEDDEKKASKDDDKDKYENVLGKERDVSKGIAGMLRLAGEKGYLDDPNAKKNKGGTLKHLESKIVAKVEFSKYDIEDKYLKKMERMGTTGSGPLRSFPEKEDYTPNVEIAYTDAQGREMDQKAAFRTMSHKFHGKAPGKKQIEKRMRQLDKKEKLKKMNSFDTPLGTLSKQIKKQEQLQSHYLVISGGRNGDPNAPLMKD